MDICVITSDALLARFIVLELTEAGYRASHGTKGDGATLYIYDLDSEGDVPHDCVGFSYSEEKRGLVAAFIKRPIDTEALRAVVAKLLVKPDVQRINHVEIDRATRKAKSEKGEVRLSSKELALLEMLCKSDTLCRADAISVFGDGESNVVDVYMHYLRKKLAKVCDGEIVCSRRGEGYSLGDKVTIKFT